MAVRLLKVSSLATAVFTSCGLYLYKYKYVDPSDFSIIRFGRAAMAVSVKIILNTVAVLLMGSVKCTLSQLVCFIL
uniref:Uncharacterized protein n=1 Tax=Erpetoichthys calabaricus TaxID=27687 RepID=A0A8C4TKA0_ERPCA